MLSNFELLLFSCLVMSDFLWPHGRQHIRLPCLSPSPEVCLNSCTLSQWYHPTILSCVASFSSCLQSFLASKCFPVSSSHQVIKVLELQLQHQSFQGIPRTDLLQDELVGSPCSPRDFQEFSIFWISVISSLNVWWNSLIKPPGTGVIIVCVNVFENKFNFFNAENKMVR